MICLILTACSDGFYGNECTETCGNCFMNAVCDKVTGQCPGQCESGWQGSLCKQGLFVTTKKNTGEHIEC